MTPIDRLRKRVESEPWNPGAEISDDEYILTMLDNLIHQVHLLDEYRSNKMWQEDQASSHRMGL